MNNMQEVVSEHLEIECWTNNVQEVGSENVESLDE